MANTKLSAFLSLLLVFVSGIVVGSVGYHVYNTKFGPPPGPPQKRSPEDFVKRAVTEMTREVHLDDAQITQLRQIYQETSAAFDQTHAELTAKLHAQGQVIHDQQVEKIKAILRPNQIPLYDALRARHEAERAARHKAEKGEIKKDQ
jgi:transposase